MPNMDFYNKFTVPLVAGEFDEHLDTIIGMVNDRRKSLGPKIYEFQVGDRVRMKNTNPKYLNGHEATVKKINRTKIVIDLDYQVGKFYRNITTPLSMVEKV